VFRIQFRGSLILITYPMFACNPRGSIFSLSSFKTKLLPNFGKRESVKNSVFFNMYEKVLVFYMACEIF
jgi:hypothetical protein